LKEEPPLSPLDREERVDSLWNSQKKEASNIPIAEKEKRVLNRKTSSEAGYERREFHWTTKEEIPS